MFWFPYTGPAAYALEWSTGLFTTGLAVLALVGAIRVALLTLRSHSGHDGLGSEAPSMPFDPLPLQDPEAEKQVAA